MRTYIWGITPFAEMLKEYIIEEENRNFVGFVVDKQYLPEDADCFEDKIFSWEYIVSCETANECEIVLGIGYNNLNLIRQKVFEKIENAGFNVGSFIHNTAIVSPSAKMGKGNVLLEHCIVQPGVEIGNANVLWSNVNICHHTKIADYCFFAASSVVLGRTVINSRCFIGCNSTIRNRVELAEKTLVSAGAFVSKSTKAGDVIMPARSVTLEEKSDDIKL